MEPMSKSFSIFIIILTILYENVNPGQVNDSRKSSSIQIYEQQLNVERENLTTLKQRYEQDQHRLKFEELSKAKEKGDFELPDYSTIISTPIFKKEKLPQPLNHERGKRRNLERWKEYHQLREFEKDSSSEEKEDFPEYSTIVETPILQERWRLQQLNENEKLRNPKQRDELDDHLRELERRPRIEEKEESDFSYSTIIAAPVLAERWRQLQIKRKAEKVRVLEEEEEHRHHLELGENIKILHNEGFPAYSTIIDTSATETHRKPTQSNSEPVGLDLGEAQATQTQDLGNLQTQGQTTNQHLYTQTQLNYPNSIQEIIQEQVKPYSHFLQNETPQQLSNPPFETKGQIPSTQQHDQHFPIQSLAPMYQQHQEQTPTVQIIQQIPSPIPSIVVQPQYTPSYPIFSPQPLNHVPEILQHPQPTQLPQNSLANSVVWHGTPQQPYSPPQQLLHQGPVMYGRPLALPLVVHQYQHPLMDRRPHPLPIVPEYPLLVNGRPLGEFHQSSLSLAASGLKTIVLSILEVMEMLIGSISLFLYVVYSAFIMPFKNDAIWWQ